jgi:spermidine synthase
MTLYTDDKNIKWFRETNSELWPGQDFSLEIEEILYHQRSNYQDVLVFKR